VGTKSSPRHCLLLQACLVRFHISPWQEIRYYYYLWRSSHFLLKNPSKTSVFVGKDKDVFSPGRSCQSPATRQNHHLLLHGCGCCIYANSVGLLVLRAKDELCTLSSHPSSTWGCALLPPCTSTAVFSDRVWSHPSSSLGRMLQQQVLWLSVQLRLLLQHILFYMHIMFYGCS